MGQIGGAGGALAPHLLQIYRVRCVNFGKYPFLVFTVAPPLKFSSAYLVSKLGGTGGSGLARGALASQSFGDL